MKIITIILGILIIIGLIGLFIGLAKGYNKTQNKQKDQIIYVDREKEELTKFEFSQPYDAQLISSSLGIDNEILLRYLYKGNNILVILDKRTKKKKAIITLKKKLNEW